MKIAISATGPDLDAEIDPRFGRCRYFVIADPDTMEFEAHENTSITASGGAGIASAQKVAGEGVSVVLTGNCGPNACQTLGAAGIEVVTGVSGRVREAIEDYSSGRLTSTPGPTVGAHFGIAPGAGRSKKRRSVGPVAKRGEDVTGSTAQGDVEVLKSQTQAMRQRVGDILHRLDNLE